MLERECLPACAPQIFSDHQFSTLQRLGSKIKAHCPRTLVPYTVHLLLCKLTCPPNTIGTSTLKSSTKGPLNVKACIGHDTYKLFNFQIYLAQIIDSCCDNPFILVGIQFCSFSLLLERCRLFQGTYLGYVPPTTESSVRLFLPSVI